MGFFIPVFVAIMVNEMRRAKGFFRLVYFLPTVIPITVSHPDLAADLFAG